MIKNFNIRMVVLASMLVASSGAMAVAVAPQGPGVVTLTNTTGNLWTAAIGNTPILGEFTDVFTFVPAATPGSFAWGTVINTSFFGMANVTFLSADLNGTSLLTGALPIFPLTYNVATLFPAPVSGALTLTIHGNNTGGGSYGGDLNATLAPVPEPSTYGMMLGGLGILAFLARGRKKSS